MVKANQPGLKRALAEWLQLRRAAGGYRPADWRVVEKGHGRIGEWQLWQAECDAEMQQYLHVHFGWPGVQWCGWLVHRQRRGSRWEEDSHVWVGGAAFAWRLRAEQAVAYLRQH